MATNARPPIIPDNNNQYYNSNGKQYYYSDINDIYTPKDPSVHQSEAYSLAEGLFYTAIHA